MNVLQQAAVQLGYVIDEAWPDDLDGEYSLKHPQAFATLHIVIDNGKFTAAWYSIRTSSYDFPGERTDLHEILSNLLAAFLLSDYYMAARLVNEGNPAVDIPGEIYARYITIEQPDLAGTDVSQNLQTIKDLLEAPVQCQSVLNEALGTPLGDNSVPPECDGFAKPAWEAAVIAALEYEAGEETNFAYSRRVNPNWTYFQDPDRGVTIIESRPLAKLVMEQIEYTSWSIVEYLIGVIAFSSSEMEVEVTARQKHFMDALIVALGGKTPEKEDGLLPLQNVVIGVTENHVIFIYGPKGPDYNESDDDEDD